MAVIVLVGELLRESSTISETDEAPLFLACKTVLNKKEENETLMDQTYLSMSDERKLPSELKLSESLTSSNATPVELSSRFRTRFAPAVRLVTAHAG